MIDPTSLRDLFDSAVALPPAQRAAFLDRACAGDSALRGEVKRLLAAHDRAGSAFDTTPNEHVAAAPVPATKSRPITLPVGTRLGPYEITQLLGAGGMGEVYKARDTRLGRTVALKVLPPDLTRDATARQRLEREARAVAALTHPNICTLHDIGRHDEIDYLVMEYLDGETLAARLSLGELGLEQALTYGVQIADALAAAHRAGVVHRDLKPGNVMLSEAGAKLLDFGLAKQRPRSVVSDTTGLQAPLTRTGTILGTVQYMAPEQLEGRTADDRTDIFALGVVLYEMVTGRRAFEGSSEASLIGNILHTEPPAPSAVNPLNPAALDELIGKCLAKKPDARWQTAAEVRARLSGIRDLQSAGDTPQDLQKRHVKPARPGPGDSPERADVASNSPSVEGVLQARGKHQPWFQQRSFLGAVALIGLSAGLTWLVTFRGCAGPGEPPRAVRFVIQPTPVESFTSLAVSPDGSSVVYGFGGLLLNRRIDQASGEPIVGSERAYEPFWSPDGRQLAFFADRDLRVVDARGGTPRVLCAARRGVGGTWNRQGTIVFSADLGTVLYKVAVGSGNAVPLRRVDPKLGQQAFRWPQFLPDGEHFLYLVRSYKSDIQGLYVGSVSDAAGKQDVKVMDSQSNGVFSLGHILSVQSGLLMATPFDVSRMTVAGESRRVADHLTQAPYSDGFALFSASPNGVLAYNGGRTPNRELRWFDRSGRAVGRVGPPDEYRDFELSHDNRRVALVKLDPQTGMQDVWVHDLERDTLLRLTSNPAHDGAPVWSPDDQRLAYGSTRDGRVAIYETLASGVGTERHIFTGPAIPFDWSPDGRRLVLQVFNAQGLTDLVFADVSSPRTLLDTYAAGPSMEGEPQFSPDGGWMAYSSSESGARQVFVEPIPRTGKRLQLSAQLGREPRWSGDGKTVFFLGSDNMLMAAALQVRSVEVSAGPPMSLFKVRVTDRDVKYHYAVGRDGSRFLVNTIVEDTLGTPIQVSVNWNNN